MKIGIIDDGVDAAHPLLQPERASSTRPASRRARRKYTTPKVIVQRTFAPAQPTWKYANVPFDPSELVPRDACRRHRGRRPRRRTHGGNLISGVAPNAYIGNYKALTIPTPGFGLDGNSAEIAAAIEAAVSDGMNVINLSLGEPEVEPSRDLVVSAIDAAAAAGVVPGRRGRQRLRPVRLRLDRLAGERVRTRSPLPPRRSTKQITDFSSAGPDPALAADEAGRRRRRATRSSRRCRRARAPGAS